MNESYQHLWDDSKEYLQLRYHLLKTELTQNLGKLIALVTAIVTVALLAAGALLYLGAALATAIAPHVGGMAAALCITAGVLLLTAILLYALRNVLFARPLTRAVAKILSLDGRSLTATGRADLENDIRRQQKVVEAQGLLCKAQLENQLQQESQRLGWRVLAAVFKRMFLR